MNIWGFLIVAILGFVLYKRYQSYQSRRDQYIQYLQSHLHHLQLTLDDERKKQIEKITKSDVGSRAGGTSGLNGEDILNGKDVDITYNGIQDNTTPEEDEMVEQTIQSGSGDGVSQNQSDYEERCTPCVPKPLFNMNVADVPETLFDAPSISVSQNDPNSSVVASNSVSTLSEIPKSMDDCEYALDNGEECNERDTPSTNSYYPETAEGMELLIIKQNKDSPPASAFITEIEGDNECDEVGGCMVGNKHNEDNGFGVGDVGQNVVDDSCDPGTDLDLTPSKQMHCTFILKSGKRMGMICSKKTHVNDMCKRHSGALSS